MIKKTSLAQKKIVHTVISNFTHFRLQAKTSSERIVLPLKNNLKKTNTPLRVVKNQEKANNSPSQFALYHDANFFGFKIGNFKKETHAKVHAPCASRSVAHILSL